MIEESEEKDPFYPVADKEPVSKPAGLRSDEGGAGIVSSKKFWWILGSLGVIVLIVGAGLVFALPGNRTKSDGDGKGFFSDLPLSLDNIIPSTTSGLSGRQCDEADRRAIGVMLASDPINRPVSGFADADFVFELPVLVSNVTRLLALYQCGRPDDIGSVRSARHDYLFLGEGADAIIGHWGGSYHALNRIEAGEFNTINALTNPFSAYFRKNNLPAPYNGFTTYDNLWNALNKLGYRNKTEFKGYKFKDSPDREDRPAGGTLSVAWPGAFRVHYEYDPETNLYQRYWAGTKQVDGGSSEPVAPSAIVVITATNDFADGPGGYNDVGIEGEGAMSVYQDGQVVKGTWKKNELQKTDPMTFLDENGKQITFTRGQVWVMAVEPSISVTWEEVNPVAETVGANASVGPQ